MPDEQQQDERHEGERPPDHIGAPYYAPGKPAEHPYGVLYQGEHETPEDGTNVAVRAHVRALATTGLPILLKSFSNVVVTEGVPQPVHAVGLPESVKREIGPLRDGSIGALSVLVRHIVVGSADRLRWLLVPRGVMIAAKTPEDGVKIRNAVLRQTIAYTVWERDRVSRDIARQLWKCGQCWVPCEQNKQALVMSGVAEHQVHVVPHPYDASSKICKLSQRKARPGRRYYSIGKWERRKGYDLLLAGFMLAHRPGEATLTLKIGRGQWKGFPTPEETADVWLTDPRVIKNGWTRAALNRDVALVRERLAANEMLRLHWDNNIYVCSSRGEAWCLPAFDAKLAGNRLVYVPFGGPEDFALPGDIAVTMKKVTVDPEYHWEPDAEWADYSAEDMASALLVAQEPRNHDDWPRAVYEDRFEAKSVGRRMARLILHQAEICDPKAAAYLRGKLLP